MNHISHFDMKNIYQRLKIHVVGLPAVLPVAFCLTKFETYEDYICNTDWNFIVWNSLAKLPNTVLLKAINLMGQN